MIDSRRWPRPTPSARNRPSSSGPRCTIASRIRVTAASVMPAASGPGGLKLITPQIPHMTSRPLEHALVVEHDPVRRFVRSDALLITPRHTSRLHGERTVELAIAAEPRVEQLAGEGDAVRVELAHPGRGAQQDVCRVAEPYRHREAIVLPLGRHHRPALAGTGARC